jgi:hypothetical protein
MIYMFLECVKSVFIRDMVSKIILLSFIVLSH